MKARYFLLYFFVFFFKVYELLLPNEESRLTLGGSFEHFVHYR